MNILERMRAGELIFDTDPEYPSLYAEFEKTMKLVAQLNSGYHTPEEIRDLLGRIGGQPLDESVRMFPPFYTNFGKFTRVGRGVFINFGCTFLDRGGITLEDGVFIGPGVRLVTENHPEQPAVRRNVYNNGYFREFSCRVIYNNPPPIEKFSLAILPENSA